LISVGHLISRKGNEFAIAALPSLPEFDLVIAGDGPEEGSLRRLAKRLGVEQRVRFLGHVEQALLPSLVGASDALLLCSSREGIANVVLEAIACGTPVLATSVWGTPEILQVPEAGLLLSDRTSVAVVDGVRELFSNLPDRAATRAYAETFTWATTSARHGEIISNIVRAYYSRCAAPRVIGQGHLSLFDGAEGPGE